MKRSLLFVIITAAFAASSSLFSQTIGNPGFETPAVEGSFNYNTPVGPGQPWEFIGGSGIMNADYGATQVTGASDGQFAFMQTPQGHAEPRFRQTISFTSIGLYTLSYREAGRGDPGGTMNYIVKIVAESGLYSVLNQSGSTTTGQPFTDISHLFRIDEPGNFVLEFFATSFSGDNTAFFDNFAVVPEPSTWALLVGGCAILAGCRRLRRRE